MKNRLGYVSFLLRVGIAFPFLYAGVSAIKTPTDWMGFFPLWAIHTARDIFGKGGEGALMLIFSIAEIVLGVWLMSGKRIRTASVISVALLVSIVVADPVALAITFRDIGLACAALALAFL